jgi:hypothetical protein
MLYKNAFCGQLCQNSPFVANLADDKMAYPTKLTVTIEEK